MCVHSWALRVGRVMVVHSSWCWWGVRSPSTAGPRLTVYSSPSSAHRPQFTILRALSSGHRPQGTVYRSPSSGHRPQVTALRSPSTGHRPQVIVLRSPPSGHRPQVTVFRSLSSGHCPQVTIHSRSSGRVRLPFAVHAFVNPGGGPDFFRLAACWRVAIPIHAVHACAYAASDS